MSQTASPLSLVASTSHTPVSAQHVAHTIDTYVSAAFERFERILVAQVPLLSEPRTEDPRKAFRLVQRLTETLVGFAVGSAIGTIASAMKRQFGTAAPAIDAELRRIASGMGVQGTVELPIRIPRFFANELVAAEKPLADDLGGRALVRIRQVAADARRHLAALAKVCGDRAGAFVMTLELLAPDETTAMAFTDQLATAWEVFRQRLGAKPTVRSLAPTPQDAARFARAEATWQQFGAAASPKAATLTTHDEVVAAGFLMQIG